MASKGQWEGEGVVGVAHLSKSENQPFTGARKGKGGSLSKSRDQEAKEAPRKGKGKGVACGDSLNDDEHRFDHNHAECIKERELVWGTPTDSDSDTQDQAAKEAPRKGKGKGVACGDSLNDDEHGFDHNHAECIKDQKLACGTPTDSDSDTPLSSDVFFPLISPELKARLEKAEELEARRALTIPRKEFQKLLVALGRSSSTSLDSVYFTD